MKEPNTPPSYHKKRVPCATGDENLQSVRLPRYSGGRDTIWCECHQPARWKIYLHVARNRRPVRYNLCDRCLQLEYELRGLPSPLPAADPETEDPS